MALDIGPATSIYFQEALADVRTIVWNGPMGCFEMEPFAEGTMAVCKAVADADCVSIHTILDDTTRHLIDARRLAFMKAEVAKRW